MIQFEVLAHLITYLNKFRRLAFSRHLDEGTIQIPLQCQESTAEVLVSVCGEQSEKSNFIIIGIDVHLLGRVHLLFDAISYTLSQKMRSV